MIVWTSYSRSEILVTQKKNVGKRADNEAHVSKMSNEIE